MKPPPENGQYNVSSLTWMAPERIGNLPGVSTGGYIPETLVVEHLRGAGVHENELAFVVVGRPELYESVQRAYEVMMGRTYSPERGRQIVRQTKFRSILRELVPFATESEIRKIVKRWARQTRGGVVYRSSYLNRGNKAGSPR